MTADPNNPLRTLQVGEQNSRGVEFDISGEILLGWNIIAGYAYTDARITRDNNFPEGNRISLVPEHSFNLWTTYQIQEGSLEGLGLGFGLFYVGEREGDLANSFGLPDYLRADAAIFYKRNRFRAALNFRNLFDIDYFETSANDRLRVFPGAPFEVKETSPGHSKALSIRKLLCRLISLLLIGFVALILVLTCNWIKNRSLSVLSSPPLENCRTIQHVAGETCIPKSPEHLATIFYYAMANALVLGVKPVGSIVVDNQHGFPQYLKDKAEGIEVLGTQSEPSIEKILLLEPDLILGSNRDQSIYPLLSQISPTALGHWYGSATWQEYFDFVAEALDKKAEA
ncbi:TonB-dependent receptor [Gloeocapsa sp. BRSZ]